LAAKGSKVNPWKKFHPHCLPEFRLPAAHTGTAGSHSRQGAGFSKLLIYCATPLTLPRYLGVSIYRLDANLRHSTVVGIVGAGGIGILLYASINQFLWHEVALILLTVFGVVVISEFVSAAVRKRIS
jgi:phosphonate transport system permease protein